MCAESRPGGAARGNYNNESNDQYDIRVYEPSKAPSPGQVHDQRVGRSVGGGTWDEGTCVRSRLMRGAGTHGETRYRCTAVSVDGGINVGCAETSCRCVQSPLQVSSHVRRGN